MYVNSKRSILFLIIAFAALPIVTEAQQSKDPAIDAKVNALLKQMTLEEKVGQMAQVSIESLGKIGNGEFCF